MSSISFNQRLRLVLRSEVSRDDRLDRPRIVEHEIERLDPADSFAVKKPDL